MKTSRAEQPPCLELVLLGFRAGPRLLAGPPNEEVLYPLLSSL
jgi:hypothetical protein